MENKQLNYHKTKQNKNQRHTTIIRLIIIYIPENQTDKKTWQILETAELSMPRCINYYNPQWNH